MVLIIMLVNINLKRDKNLRRINKKISSTQQLLGTKKLNLK